MTAVAVLVPWRAGDPDRERALAFVTPRLATIAHELVLGLAPDGAWNKAAAVEAALADTDAELLVIADADVWCDGLAEAIDAVRSGAAAWAIPHMNVYRLDEDATAGVLATGVLAAGPGGLLAENVYRGHPGGGMVVLRRDVYESCPLDRRFVGWGQEDESWAMALTCLHGAPWRGSAPLWHLWHQPQPRATRRIGSAAGRELWQRYSRARRRPDLMRQLIDEARTGVPA